MKKNTKKATKTSKSLKGKWGKVGAPPKTLRAYPRTKFTVDRYVAMNAEVSCELTVRNRIKDDVASGVLVKCDVIRQPKGGVGRPKFSYMLKELVANTVPVATVKPVVKTEPTPEPTPAPVTSADVTPVTEPVATVATVVTPAPLP